MTKAYRKETLQLHAGYTSDPTTKSAAVPIYQTTSYVFDSSEDARELFALEKDGNIYTRIMNPTTDVLEQRMAAVEGGTGALAVSSGMAAITLAVLNICETGDNIVSAGTLYGGTYNLFKSTLPKYGIETKMADPNDIAAFEAAIDDKTKAIYVESIGNPGINIPDFGALSALAKKHGLPFIVDNTFAPTLIDMKEAGADIVVYSATKFIGGHGTSVAGLLVDMGTFDWHNARYPGFTQPDDSYHGIVYADLGQTAFITKARVQMLRDLGSCVSPFNAFMLIQGLETLSLRIERHIENTHKIIEFLSHHPAVSWVNYPELENSPYKALADTYFPKGTGSIFTFGIKGGKPAAVKFIDNVDIFLNLANVADAKSLVIHPASTTHQQLGPEDLKACGLSDDMIRVSVGLENADDLIEALDEALAISQA